MCLCVCVWGGGGGGGLTMTEVLKLCEKISKLKCIRAQMLTFYNIILTSNSLPNNKFLYRHLHTAFRRPYGLANQKLCYIPMLLNNEKSGEKDQEVSKEWLVNTDPGSYSTCCTF